MFLLRFFLTATLLQHLRDSTYTIVESFNNRDRAELVRHLRRLGLVFNLHITCICHTFQAMVQQEIACNSAMAVAKTWQFCKLHEEKAKPDADGDDPADFISSHISSHSETGTHNCSSGRSVAASPKVDDRMS